MNPAQMTQGFFFGIFFSNPFRIEKNLNDATFETLEEARLSAPTTVQNLEQNETKIFASMDVLDGITEGTVFV